MIEFGAFASAVRRRSLASAAVAAVLVASAPVRGAPGTRVVEDVESVRLAWAAARDPSLGYKEPPGTVNRYLTVAGKSDDFGYAYLPWGRALFAPFRWEASVGVPFAERTDGTGDAAFGIEVVTNRTDALTFALQARRSAAGLEVTAVGLQGAVLGQKDYAGATSVDLAIDHDGSEMRFYARAEGAPSWDVVGFASEILPEALYPVMSVYDLARPGVVAFDDFRVVDSATPDGTPQGVVLLQRAFDGCLDVLHRLDGNPPNLEAVGIDLGTVRETLDESLPELAGKARSRARGAAAKLSVAAKLLRRGRPVAKVVGPVRAAVERTNAARLAYGDL